LDFGGHSAPGWSKHRAHRREARKSSTRVQILRECHTTEVALLVARDHNVHSAAFHPKRHAARVSFPRKIIRKSFVTSVDERAFRAET
jgi:hypothetical protein